MDPERLNSLIFGLAVMALAVVTGLVGAALFVKLRTARHDWTDRRAPSVLLRNYEQLARSTAATLDRHTAELAAIRSRVAEVEQKLDR